MARKTVKKKENDYSEFFAALAAMEEEKGIPQKYIAEKIANAFSLRLSTTKNISYKDNKIHQITYFLKDHDNMDKKLYKMRFSSNAGFSIGEVNIKSAKYIYVSSVEFEKDN